MKNKKIRLSIILIVIALVFCVLLICLKQCKKEPSENVPSDLYSEWINDLNYDDIDNISMDIAKIHTFEIYALLSDTVLANMEDGMDEVKYVYDRVMEDYKNLDLQYISKYFGANVDDSIREKMILELNKEVIEGGHSENVTVNSFMEQIDSAIVKCFMESDTYEEFCKRVDTETSAIVRKIEDKKDYFAVRVCADIAKSSFDVWTDYFYGNNGAKEKENAWQKLKAMGEKIVEKGKELDPYIKADWEGAKDGATIGGIVAAAETIATDGAGARVGGYIVIGGAAVGAVAGSVHYNNSQNNNNNNGGGR